MNTFLPIGTHTRHEFDGQTVFEVPRPDGATVLMLQAEHTQVFYTLDGSAPTLEHGFLLLEEDLKIWPLGSTALVNLFSPNKFSAVQFLWGVYTQ